MIFGNKAWKSIGDHIISSFIIRNRGGKARRKRPFLRSPLVSITLRQLLSTPQMDVSDTTPAFGARSSFIFQSISMSVFTSTVSLLLLNDHLLDFSFILGEVLPLYKQNVFFSLPRLVFDLPTSPAG